MSFGPGGMILERNCEQCSNLPRNPFFWEVMPVRRHYGSILIILGAICMVAAPVIRAQQQQQAPPAPTGPMAPEKYKDIQVLKDVPADQLDVTMRYFSPALGWQCQNCHMDRATGTIDYTKDTPSKTTARKMINLVRVANDANQDYGAHFNCGTCHQGRNQPAGLQAALV